MPTVILPVKGRCPRCDIEIPLSRIEPHPVKPIAHHYYDCPSCGEVLVRVYDISVPKPDK
jgi:Zn finger protein HypA/HybF involved in hydrogenase expression